MRTLEYRLPRTVSRRAAPKVNCTPKALLALALSFTTLAFVGPGVPFADASPTAEKKPKQDPVLKGLPVTELSVDEAILHALNRLAYGPRPGDIDRIKQMGLAKWVDQQLNPNSINDSAVEARLEAYPTLKMSTAQLLAEYPQPKQAAKQELRAQNQNQRPGDAAAAVIAQDIQANKSGAAASTNQTDAVQQAAQGADTAINSMAAEMDASAPPAKPARTSDARTAASNADAPSPMKMMDPPTRGVRRDALGQDPNVVPRVVSDESRRPARIVEELAMAKMLRAIYSERQLQQVMDDFWFNHFNVYAGKGAVKWYLTSYERDVIQPHTFGKFRDLVTSTAKSPAMLF